MNRYIFDDLTKACMNGLTTGLMRAYLGLSTEMEKRERKCSKINCPLQYNENEKDFDSNDCQKAC